MKTPEANINHMALIVDGNRRWAKERGISSYEGHRSGFLNTIDIANYIHTLGIDTATFWLFSTENWNRSDEEVDHLMQLFKEIVDLHLKNAIENKIMLVHLGRKDRLPAPVIDAINQARDMTQKFLDRTICLAIDYGGRDEIIRGCELVSKNGGVITIENLVEHLDTSILKYPNPDLIFRSSGEKRLSGFMIWQAIYSEFYFEKKFFPDVTPEDIDAAIEDFHVRSRRFGKG